MQFDHTDRLMTSRQLREALGGISEMTIWRYERDESLGFPKALRIRKRRYWRVADVEQWVGGRNRAAVN